MSTMGALLTISVLSYDDILEEAVVLVSFQRTEAGVKWTVLCSHP